MNATVRLRNAVLWMLLLTLPVLGFTPPAHDLCPETGLPLVVQHSHQAEGGHPAAGEEDLHHDHHTRALKGAHHQPQAATDQTLQQDLCPDCSQCLLSAIVLNGQDPVAVAGGKEPPALALLLPETPNLDLTGPPPRRLS
ncbi:hypothetical protein [uncultured Marinobacter sp.]|uniref:hypothetical protein n=1 Tax=uncultured Marinobacter sp. TaxID=187379 RepID=UPI0030DA897D